MTSSNLDCRLDPTVVKVRDMIAHGRVAGKEQKPPFQLMKFGKPINGMVPVEAVVMVDREWLKANNKLVLDQVAQVFRASKELGQNSMEFV